ncbi:MAG: spore coat protein CotJB [Christensenellaceae bacterium]|jgi:spore coat protein JB|nr:spore coat protein CotJB [Christensenellaceae bacterium]
MMTSTELLRKISEYQFVTVELNLYLDTHPGDELARADYYYYSARLKEVMELYEAAYGPLMNFGHSPTDAGSYVDSAWPWE